MIRREEPDTSPADLDEEAMAALARGQNDALNAIMDRWSKPVTAFLYRSIGDYETALDLAQEVFVRLYRSRHTYKRRGTFSSYLFTIATNHAKNHFRWKSRHPEAELDEKSNQSIAGAGLDHLDPRARLEKSEDAQRVRDALLSLPDKLRLPMILFYYDEMSHAEIAGIFSCSEKTIETRLYRGRKLLGEKLS